MIIETRDLQIDAVGEQVEIAAANYSIAKIEAREKSGAWGTAVLRVGYRMSPASPVRDFIPAIRITSTSPSPDAFSFVAPMIVVDVITAEGAADVLSIDIFLTTRSGV